MCLLVYSRPLSTSTLLYLWHGESSSSPAGWQGVDMRVHRSIIGVTPGFHRSNSGLSDNLNGNVSLWLRGALDAWKRGSYNNSDFSDLI